MRIPMNRYTIPTAFAAVMLVLTACSGAPQPSTSKAQEATQPVATQSTDAPSPLTTTIPPTTEPAATEATPAPLTQFDRLTAVEYKGRAPASTKTRGAINGPSYIQAIMTSYLATWRPVFSDGGLTIPRMRYDITARGERYVSECYSDGQPIVVQTGTHAMLFCSKDNIREPSGAIALPLGNLTKIWEQAGQRQGDLAVAITVTRQASLMTAYSLQAQLSLPSASNLGVQYAAACFAGAWAHAVYPQSRYTEKEVSVALERSFAIPSMVDGTVTSPKAGDQQAVTAWIVGFRGGNPAECGRQFWK